MRLGIGNSSGFPSRCVVGTGAAIAAWLDVRYGWITPVFDAVAHLFYEVPLLAGVRRPSQLVLVRWHLAILSALIVLWHAGGGDG